MRVALGQQFGELGRVIFITHDEEGSVFVETDRGIEIDVTKLFEEEV